MPHGPDGTKAGLDDYLATNHSVEELLALASPELPQIEVDEDLGRYSVIDGRTFQAKHRGGDIIQQELANFSAVIVEEVSIDDGAEESKQFGVEARLASDGAPTTIRVEAKGSH